MRIADRRLRMERSSHHTARELALSRSQLVRLLVVIGGINWGLVGFARLDLVALLTRNRFGGTSAASRLVYGLVGLAAAAQAAELVTELQDRSALTS